MNSLTGTLIEDSGDVLDAVFNIIVFLDRLNIKSANYAYENHSYAEFIERHKGEYYD